MKGKNFTGPMTGIFISEEHKESEIKRVFYKHEPSELKCEDLDSLQDDDVFIIVNYCFGGRMNKAFSYTKKKYLEDSL